jgi:rapamycin-insensitive companion of mTOR
LITDPDPLRIKIVDLITDLCNPVLSKRRAHELYGIKMKKPACLQDTAFFHKVMKLLGQYHFRLPVLRFVIDLFDKRVMKRIVLDEDVDEDDSDSDEDDSE